LLPKVLFSQEIGFIDGVAPTNIGELRYFVLVKVGRRVHGKVPGKGGSCRCVHTKLDRM